MLGSKMVYRIGAILIAVAATLAAALGDFFKRVFCAEGFNLFSGIITSIVVIAGICIAVSFFAGIAFGRHFIGCFIFIAWFFRNVGSTCVAHLIIRIR